MIKQLSVFVENEVGSLAGVTAVLKENKINLKAAASFDTPEFGIMRIVVDQPEEAKAVLIQEGFVVKISEVIGVELVDQPGDLDRVLHIIADAGLCVNYIYSFVLRENNAPVMIFHVNQLKMAEEVLKNNNVKVVNQ
ncbi:ACT domain-containing protein [Anaeromicropila populeti]|uniref:Uncharacterized conserved protein, contains tandem ACT domains n=1 Tax=Anaeromicropila populeti TaxID=37658 RepID=A0A1I6LG19_9FIRM|nr:ACT domain-containing protein [Anaeromicropila populeti]SFS02188.1 Uncharacterized conserved protein, contains tandem ACT domains [Anaeromicropila populeti]